MDLSEVSRNYRGPIQVASERRVFRFHSVLHQFQLALDSGVEVVFNVVVRPPGQELCYFSPFVAKVLVSLDDDLIFVFSPFSALYVWVEMVMPTFSTLLPDSPRKMARD